MPPAGARPAPAGGDGEGQITDPSRALGICTSDVPLGSAGMAADPTAAIAPSANLVLVLLSAGS